MRGVANGYKCYHRKKAGGCHPDLSFRGYLPQDDFHSPVLSGLDVISHAYDGEPLVGAELFRSFEHSVSVLARICIR